MKKQLTALVMAIIMLISAFPAFAASEDGSDDSYVSVTYKYGSNEKNCEYYLEDDGSFPIWRDLKNRIIGDQAIIGWKDDNGHEYIYKNAISNDDLLSIRNEYTDAFDVKSGDELVLTPIYTPVSISPDETFSFSNSEYNFPDGYRMTKAHAKQIKNCYKAATKNNEFRFLGALIGLIVKTIYQIVPWGGSCCGFPIAILMQHYGMIDLLSGQDADSIEDLQPTKEITSALNFYNAVTPAAVVCANKAAEPGTDGYKAQAKKLFETVSDGNPVVSFIYCGYVNGISYKSPCSIIKGILSQGIKSLAESFEGTHCILFTGAYIDGNGNKVLIGYDENKASYYEGNPQIYIVSDDYGDICELVPVVNISSKSRRWSYDLVGVSLESLAWMDDISFLESFKADGETDPTAWYSYLSANRDALS